MVELLEADLPPFGPAHAVEFRGYHGVIPPVALPAKKIRNIGSGRPISLFDERPD